MASGALISGLFIDVVTLIVAGFFWLVRGPRRNIGLAKKLGVSVIIPAYNEESHIEDVIESALNQSLQPKRVIVIDDNSTDRTAEICRRIKKKYKNLKVIRQRKNMGKAHNVSYVLMKEKLEDVTIVLDADTTLSERYLEEIVKPFSNGRVVIATGLSLPIRASNIFGRVIYYGAVFQYRFFCFRKRAHSYRNSIAVVTGDSAAYRTSFLNEVGGLPQGTQTEDMDITWLALEKGYRVSYVGKANARSHDPSTFIGHWKQITRWYQGAFQCVYRHGRNLRKAKPLLFTTLIPFGFDTFTYTPIFLLSLYLYFIFPTFIIAFLLGDLVFTLLAIFYVDWKLVARLPEIYIIKVIWSIAWLYAFFKTSGEYFILGRRDWGGGWSRKGFYAKSGASRRRG